MVNESGGRLARYFDTVLHAGRLDLIMLVGLAVITVAANVTTVQNLAALGLDLIVLSAAAFAVYRPGPGSTALAIALLAYMFVPADWPSLSVYAPLVVIAGLGVRGQRRERAWFAPILLAELLLISWRSLPSGTDPLPYLLAWTLFVGISWLVGSAGHRMIIAAEESRQLAALESRHELSRELHDGVAEAISSIAMRARMAGMASQPTAEDLAAIADDAARALEELYEVINLLRDGTERPAEPLVSLENMVEQSRKRLRSNGFRTRITWDGPHQGVSSLHSHAIGRIIQEATTNIIRHGDPGYDCAIIIETTPESIELAFLNRPLLGEVRPAETGFGILSMCERTRTLGGTLASNLAGDTWITNCRIPIGSILSDKAAP